MRGLGRSLMLLQRESLRFGRNGQLKKFVRDFLAWCYTSIHGPNSFVVKGEYDSMHYFGASGLKVND